MDAFLTEYNFWWLGLSAIAFVLNLLAFVLFRKTWLELTSLAHGVFTFLGGLNYVFGPTGSTVFTIPVMWINLLFLALSLGFLYLFERLTPSEDKRDES
jgi:hypothetical protein